MKTKRRQERGQAMVEFAIVLPLLILMTLGGIYLTLSYLNKLRMNGLAFMAARMAVVRAENFNAPSFVLERYKQTSQQNWVDKLTVESNTPLPNQSRITLNKPLERLEILANAMDILSGGGSLSPTVMTAQVNLPREYWTFGGEARPRTRSIVDYRYSSIGNLPWLELLDKIPDSIFNTTQMADTPLNSINNNDLLSLVPPNQNLMAFYAARGWSEADYRANREKEKGQFERMRIIGTHFKAIENGASLVGYLAEFAGFGTALKAVLGEVGEELSITVENTMTQISTTLDKHIRASVQGNTIPGKTP